MAGEWQTVRIENIAEKVAMGPFGSSIKVETFVPEGMPVISGAHLRGTRLEDGNFNFVSFEHAGKLKNANVFRGDVIFTHAGNIGQVAYIPEDSHYERYVISQRQFYLRCNRSKAQPEFVTYYFKSHEGQHKLLANASQVGVPSIARPSSYLKTIEIPLPPLDEQRAIAHILGTLDDKIELNRRMNETLEAIARAMFKSWFVDFDPVRAKMSGEPPEAICQRLGLTPDLLALFPVRLVDSELGEIPEGWDVSRLSKVCARITDGSHFSPKSEENGRPMASVKDMENWGFQLSDCRRISEEDYEELVRNDCRPLTNDVLIAKDGSYLKHIFVVEHDLDIVILSSIAILRPNVKIDPQFLAFTLKSETTLLRMEQYVSGAVLQRIVLKAFREFPIVLPPRVLQDAWFDFVGSMIQRCWRNVEQNEVLASLRDALLPKLLSGELRVPDAANLIEAAAA